jgi:hypothetical protein
LGQKVVDKTDVLKASGGTVYVVTGGAGAPFYDVTTPLPSSRINKTHVNHYMLVDATAASISIDAFDTTGTSLDHFQMNP